MFTTKTIIKGQKIDFSAFEEHFKSETDCLHGYFERNDLFIKYQTNKLETKLLIQIDQDVTKESVLQEFYEEEVKTLSSLYYHSSLTLIHSNLEKSLAEICMIIKNKTNYNFSLEALANRDLITKSVEYLKLTCGLLSTDIEKDKL